MNKKTIALPLLIIALSVILMASGEGEHDFWGGFLKKTFNSVLLFGGLFFLLRKPIAKFLGLKSVEIKKEIKAREKTISEKKNLLAEIHQRLDKIEAEVSRMKSEAEKRGKEEGKRIAEAGNQEAERIIAMTEAEIDQRVQSAIRKLKTKVADLTIVHFKESIKKELDQGLHEKIIKKNIKASGEIIERK